MSNELKIRRGITSKFIFIQKALSVVMLIALVFLVFAQVILRSFNLPQMGIEELVVLPIIWLYMLGGANASEEKSHISVDVLEVFFHNQTVLAIVDLVRNSISLLIGIVLTYWMFEFVSYSLSVWKLSALLSIPMFFLESALFIGVLLMTLYTLSDVVFSIKNTKNYFKKTNRKGEI